MWSTWDRDKVITVAELYHLPNGDNVRHHTKWLPLYKAVVLKYCAGAQWCAMGSLQVRRKIVE